LFNHKQVSRNDFFISINYFLFLTAIILFSFPDAAAGRLLYFWIFGLTILCGKLILSNRIIGAICILTVISFRFVRFGGQQEYRGLSWILGGDFLNPAYGLVKMIGYLVTYQFNLPTKYYIPF
jgi:hypothetical protein